MPLRNHGCLWTVFSRRLFGWLRAVYGKKKFGPIFPRGATFAYNSSGRVPARGSWNGEIGWPGASSIGGRRMVAIPAAQFCTKSSFALIPCRVIWDFLPISVRSGPIR